MVQLVKKVQQKLIQICFRSPKYWARDYFYFRSLNRKPPELIWKILRRSYDRHYDAGAVQIDDKLYLIGGFESISNTIKMVDIFDLKIDKWVGRFPMPEEMAETHHAIVTDGKRFIYCSGGQLGPQCRPATPKCFSLDVQTRKWQSLPDLPQARYAMRGALWNGRFHVMGGSEPDRKTPAVDHWSIAVKDGQAIEKTWKKEVDAPRGGPHGACVILNDKMYFIGGQEGDWVAIPGDPEYRGIGNVVIEEIYPDTYFLEKESNQWKRLSDMPVASSHIEYSYVIFNNTIIVVGGMIRKNPETYSAEVTDVVQAYNIETDTWKVVGRLPYRLKHTAAAYYNGWLYITTGQRDKGVDDPSAGAIVDRTWKAKVPSLIA